MRKDVPNTDCKCCRGQLVGVNDPMVSSEPTVTGLTASAFGIEPAPKLENEYTRSLVWFVVDIARDVVEEVLCLPVWV